VIVELFQPDRLVSSRTSDAPSPPHRPGDPFGLLSPLWPSPLPTSPREGKRLVTNEDASTNKTSEEVLSTRRLSTPPDDPTLFARGLIDLLLDGFTNRDFTPRPIPRQASPVGLCSTTRPADKSAAPDPHVRVFRTRATCPRRDSPAGHHRMRSIGTNVRHLTPPAGNPDILVAQPNSEDQERPSFHRPGQDPALQRTPRRAHLGYRSDAFHRQPPGTATLISEERHA
jgi:hypothetical protein